MKRSKTYRQAEDRIDRSVAYSPKTALEVLKSLPDRKFDESVEADWKLSVDPRKADQLIRGTVTLPHGTGKTVRVAVFAKGPQAEAARQAGADIVGDDDLIEAVSKGNIDFDVAIATPELMGKVGRLGRILGPRGLMPNPRTGTVTTDTAKAVKEIKGGKIAFRVDKDGNLCCLIGKKSFSAEDLLDNYKAVATEINHLRPATVKGKYITHMAFSTTMSPGISVDINTL
ncbi:MAG: 50S ribosomal protein L1 [Aeriscardovia sp.]|nr:50S ribosomal protein L1 [Aeriscardovia sp.]MBQ1357228.1 50S ribosomal protein L1 [Aeriscardovia sp.]MBQ5500325.1 50S ribosomal protein L1 [Aeriscardovia sp.]MBQ5521043.1 50S ribosomal protein L1 [Aeriscardovia sp.]